MSIISMDACGCACTQRERPGMREREFENKVQKSSFEIIHIDHECFLEKTVCTAVKNMVSKSKSCCFRPYFKQSQAI